MTAVSEQDFLPHSCPYQAILWKKIELVKITGTVQLEVISPAGQSLPQRCLEGWQSGKGQNSHLKWIYNLPI